MHRHGARWALVALAVLGALALAAGTASAQERYRTYDEMKQDLQALADEHDVAEYRVIGESTLGQEIVAVDVANNITDRSEAELGELPTLYVDGAHHGNEILSAEAAYYALERVLERADGNASYLEGQRLIVNPIQNPDGYTRDQRENANGVDLNRNYPFHWGLYGTSEAPFTGTYRGEAPASEVETQSNIELMRKVNLYAFLTGHTGTYDLVLPWSEDEDGEMPDWPLYETTLSHIENETGLEYREPSGAGEAHAWAYGNRSAFGLLPEVDTEQSAPASSEPVEQRLDEVLQVYRITWENLTHLGGHLHVEELDDGQVTVLNNGWGPAYNVTAGAETIDELGSGETATLPADGGEVTYERLTVPGEEPGLATSSLSLEAAAADAEAGSSSEASPVPAPGVAALAAALAALALLARRR